MARRWRRGTRHGGFTLLEILVAIVVLATGITCFISLYLSSVGVADFSRNQAIAAQLAQEKLTELVNDPGAYIWEVPDSGRGTIALPSKAKDAAPEKGPFPVGVPSILPVGSKHIGQHEKNLFDRFTWDAYTDVNNKDAGYAFLTVVIRWKEPGQDRVLPLTTCVARSRIAAAGKPVDTEVKK